MRSRFRILTAALVCVSLLAGCVPTGTLGSQRSSAVTLVLGPRALTLDPYSPVLSARQLGRLLFSGLFVQTADGPVPDLALRVPTKANGDLSADGRSATIRLRPRSWQDGKPVTAEDVAFTWRLLRDGILTDGRGAGDAIAGVTAIASDTVRVSLTRADSPALWRLVPYVLPAHLLGESDDVAGDAYWARPVGSGPYRVASVGPQSVKLEPSDRHGIPLDVVFAPDDGAARSAFDSADRAVWLDSPPGAATPNESYVAASGAEWRLFRFNLRPGRVTAEPAVREALSLMTPAATPTVSAAGPLGGVVTPASAVATVAAGRLLERAGWKVGKDGIRVRAGKRLHVDLATFPLQPEDGYRMQSILAWWQQAGVDGVLKPGSAGFYAPYDEGGRLAQGDFDVAWTSSALPRPLGWLWAYDSAAVPSAARPAGGNVAGISDAELDRASAALRSAGDTGTAGTAAALAWRRLLELHAIVPDAPVAYGVLSKGVTGVSAEGVAEEALRGAAGWRSAGDGS